MNDIALIALDLDGTLLDPYGTVTDRSKRAVRAVVHSGRRVVLCTGRPPRLTRHIAEELELSDVAIVFNGASTYHVGLGTCEHHRQVDTDVALKLVEQIRARLPGAGIGLETHHGWYLDTHLYERARERLAAAGLAPPDGVGAVETFIEDRVIKIFVRHDVRSPAEMWDLLGPAPVYATWSGAGMLEMMHPQVNKREALEQLTSELGIEREQVMAFGDQNNDVEMLAWAGFGVAPANAVAEARAAADEVTASNAEDGVAQVLERIVEHD